MKTINKTTIGREINQQTYIELLTLQQTYIELSTLQQIYIELSTLQQQK